MKGRGSVELPRFFVCAEEKVNPMRMSSKGSKISGTEQCSTEFQYRGKAEPFGWRETGAMFGLGGGLFCNVFGLFLTAVAWFMSTGGIAPTLHSIGTVLLLANIPLLMAGAHCLDLVQNKKRIAVLMKLGSSSSRKDLREG